jgi:Protein of unknown function (DUF2510)
VGVVHLSGGEWVVAGIIAVVGSVIGYRLSENDRRTFGRTPWGLPSLVWALFWFLSLVLGLVLYLIAHSNEVRRQHGSPAAYPGTGRAAVGGAPGPRTLSVADQFPAYPRPANLQPERAEPEAVAQPDTEPTEPAGQSGHATPVGPAPAPASRPAWTLSPPAWHPDPSGRFHYRWWDGNEWTSQVSIDGRHLIDTNPDQRIGPY